ncbi:MAG: UDP-N-acetylmuramate dehydrogenase [Anaerolineae bacterium]
MTAKDGVATSGRLAEALEAHLGAGAVRKAEPLARYTALRVGGPAELLVVAEEVAALRAAAELAWQHGVACRILGGGSNALVSDAGVRGLVVLNRAGKVTFGGGEVWAESGASFSTLARRCVSRGLAGLEWAAGIPGTVGGAVVGNAGAWGGDVASVLDRVRVLEPDGTVALWPAERMGYGYRSSVLKGQGAGGERQTVVLEALFRLQPGEAQSLEQRLAEITQQRKSSQPPGATCGSVFKNPPGDYAGRLIEAAGLKGTSHGGAVISPVHANFVVNQGGATAGDVKALIDLARREVEAGTGVRLELEIELLGEWQ